MSKIIYENCDCMAGMARYPDKYFDLAIVDPPYGIGANKEKSDYYQNLANEVLSERNREGKSL